MHFLGTFGGTAGPVKGSGVIVEFSVTAQRECNSLTGSLVIQALKNDIEYLQRFTQEISSSIFVRVKGSILPSFLDKNACFLVPLFHSIP